MGSQTTGIFRQEARKEANRRRFSSSDEDLATGFFLISLAQTIENK
jgi:hypothetical protein